MLLDQWMAGLQVVLTVDIWLLIIAGTSLGIIVGIIPGLDSMTCIALLLPLTFYMQPLNALVFLSSIYVSVMFGGELTATLLNTPGGEENLCTTLDGFPMTCRGQAGEALGLGIGSSVVGGVISYIFLLVSAAPVARFAMKFGPTEMFLIALTGIIFIAALRGESLAKGLLAGAFGLLIGGVGIAPTGEWRATFGQMYLSDGVPFVPAMIGLIAVAELFVIAERDLVAPATTVSDVSFRRILRGMRWVFEYPGTIIRSSLLGIIIGAIPGTGATVGSAVSYNLTKRLSKTPEKFGTGFPPGIIAAETANNATTGGALMTTLMLGVPGSGTCALLLGAMTMQGIHPGPQILREQSDLVYGIAFALLLSQVLMVIMAAVGGYFLAYLLFVPTATLVPVVVLYCMIGSLAIRSTEFDVFLMGIFGVVGWLMVRTGFPPIAMVLGVILGPIADAELVRSSMRYGDQFYFYFFSRPLSLVLTVVIVAVLVAPYVRSRYVR